MRVVDDSDTLSVLIDRTMTASIYQIFAARGRYMMYWLEESKELQARTILQITQLFHNQFTGKCPHRRKESKVW